MLTQKVGGGLESDKKTCVCFIDLLQAFDTGKRRLLWARLRSLGINGKLLRALRAGYGDRKLVGKLGSSRSKLYRDIGLGVRRGEIDSAGAFAAFIDDLDAEIERYEKTIGRKLGLPFVWDLERAIKRRCQH